MFQVQRHIAPLTVWSFADLEGKVSASDRGALKSLWEQICTSLLLEEVVDPEAHGQDDADECNINAKVLAAPHLHHRKLDGFKAHH